MPITTHNPAGVFPPYRSYSHAVEVAAGSRLLFISGLNGHESDGKTMPDSFEGQAELIWAHLQTILKNAGMGLNSLVCLRFYLADMATDVDAARGVLGEAEAVVATLGADLPLDLVRELGQVRERVREA